MTHHRLRRILSTTARPARAHRDAACVASSSFIRAGASATATNAHLITHILRRAARNISSPNDVAPRCKTSRSRFMRDASYAERCINVLRAYRRACLIIFHFARCHRASLRAIIVTRCLRRNNAALIAVTLAHRCVRAANHRYQRERTGATRPRVHIAIVIDAARAIVARSLRIANSRGRAASASFA